MDFNSSARATSGTNSLQYNEGLRAYMLRIYNYMAAALGITGIVAYLASSSPALMQSIYGTPLQFVVMLAPLGIVMYLSMRINRLSVQSAQLWFWGYAGAMGLSLSYVFLVYTGASVARCFFITASVFAGMSLYGYTTKKDLTGMGSFMLMGLFGLIVASLVNIFLKSSGLDFAISAIGVLIFTGLTAYDTQRLKEVYYASGGSEDSISRASIMGALTLYLDFINLMLMLLRFVGDRK
jgi:FtsH-binding integral membrane protein